MLPCLPDNVVTLVCEQGLTAQDLCALEATSPRFRQPETSRWRKRKPSCDGGGGAAVTATSSLIECAAEGLVRRRAGGWRLAPLSDESWKYLLFVLESKLWTLQPIAAGQAHSLVLDPAEDKLFSFGQNTYSQLGHGCTGKPTPHRPKYALGVSPQLVNVCERSGVASVAAGAAHSAALTPDGTLYTWGAVGRGVLGNVALEEGFEVLRGPRAVSLPEVSLPAAVGRPLAQRRVAMVAAGARHTACLSNFGEVFSWGDGDYGKLGHGDFRDQPSPKRVAALLEGEHGRAAGIACGTFTTAVVLAEGGALLMCGFLPTPESHGDRHEAAVPELVTFPLCAKDSATSGAVKICNASCGDDHFAAVSTDGILYTWGDDSDGQLGIGVGSGDAGDEYDQGADYDDEAVDTPRAVHSLLSRGRVLSVSCGAAHTAAIVIPAPGTRRLGALSQTVGGSGGGELWTWGRGQSGRLGHGDEADVRLPRLVRLPAQTCPRNEKHAGSGSLLSSTSSNHNRRRPASPQAACAVRMTKASMESVEMKAVAVNCGPAHTIVTLVSPAAISQVDAITSGSSVSKFMTCSFGCGVDGRLGHGDTGTLLEPSVISGV